MEEQASHSVSQNATQGKVFGSILLVSGCCIGAGMVGLPLVTYAYGFLPSIFVLIVAWIFMLSTGLLLLEVTLAYKDRVNLLTIAKNTLGPVGKNSVAVLFIFLFFSLLVAYISGVGEILSKTITQYTPLSFNNSVGSGFAFIVLAVLLALGTQAVDHFNRISFYLMLFGFLLLIAIGVKFSQTERVLSSKSFAECFLSLPVVIVSFGYQNLIPSLAHYLDRDKKKLQLSIVIGTAIPLIVYCLWEFVFFGVTNLEGISEHLSSKNSGAIDVISSRISVPALGHIFCFFSFFALITALLAVGLSFHDFVLGRVKLRKSFSSKLGFSLLLLLPSGALSILCPNLFMKGLGLAGGVAAVLLFGVIPVLVAWKHRYLLNLDNEQLLSGGKPMLVFLLGISLIIFSFEIYGRVASQIFFLTLTKN